MTKKFVIYKRLSKVKAGGNQHGLDGQEFAIQEYLNSVGDYEVIGTYGEFFSGGLDWRKRKEMVKAVDHAEREKACLIVAKLDRAARDVESLAHLMKRVDLVIATLPGSDDMTKHVLAAVAQFEWNAISSRTKAALKIAKSKGIRLGGKRAGAGSGGAKLKEMTIKKAIELAPTIDLYRNKHGMTLAQTAEALNSAGITTPHGGRFVQSTVHNYIKHAKNNQRTEA